VKQSVCAGQWEWTFGIGPRGSSVTLHQLSLVDVGNPPLQLLRVFGEELELGAVALRVFPGVVVANFSCEETREEQKKRKKGLLPCIDEHFKK